MFFLLGAARASGLDDDVMFQARGLCISLPLQPNPHAVEHSPDWDGFLAAVGAAFPVLNNPSGCFQLFFSFFLTTV